METEYDIFKELLLKGGIRGLRQELRRHDMMQNYYHNHINGFGETPEDLEILKNDVRRVKAWVQHYLRAWPSKPRLHSPPLLLAYALGLFKVAEDLVKTGINTIHDKIWYMNTRTTYLHVAVILKKNSLAKTLINYGASVSERDERNGKTALYEALKANCPFDLVRLLVLNCDRQELIYPGRLTASYLYIAVIAANEKVVELLLKQPEIDPTIKDVYSSKTLLHYAAEAERESVQIVKWLLKKGVDVNVSSTCHNHTALHLALATGKWEMAKILIKKGADVNAADDEGNLPIFLANRLGINESLTELILLMILKGADVGRKHKFGQTVLRACIGSGRIGGSAYLIVQHLAALQFLENKELDPVDVDIISSTSYLQHHFDQCTSDMETMRTYKIYNDITLFDALKGDKLPKLLRNEQFKSSFSSLSFAVCPLYNYYIRLRLEAAEKKMLAARAVENNLRSIFSNYLNEHAIQKIGEYVSIDDLPGCKL